MSEKEKSLEQDLQELCELGITHDRNVLLEDIVSQFDDEHLFIREYVVNAIDAHAENCWVSGTESISDYTIRILDDGMGAAREEAVAMLTAFDSRKRGDPQKIVGEKGVGLLSVAVASLGQIRWKMTSSTGKESWRIEAGNLLSSENIVLERIEPVPETHGCLFEVTFKKGRGPFSLEKEMRRYNNILEKSLLYQNRTKVFVAIPDPKGEHENIRQIGADWASHNLLNPRRFFFTVAGYDIEEVFGIGPAIHELYNKRVFVTSNVSLTHYELQDEEKLRIPHLTIRADSPQFKLNLGRNFILNSQILHYIAQKNREVCLPEYLEGLKGLLLSDRLNDAGLKAREVEEMIVAFLSDKRVSKELKTKFDSVPLIYVLNRANRRLSLDEIRAELAEHGKLYIINEDLGAMGADFDAFKAPVISQRQVPGMIKMLSDIYGDRAINLQNDKVIEAPPGMSAELSDNEKIFERHLFFDPNALRYCQRQMDEARKKDEAARSKQHDGAGNGSADPGEMDSLERRNKETRQAQNDLSRLKWRINYCLNSNNFSPNKTQRFIVNTRDSTVTLNLHHADVRQLSRLKDKILAGHWALAMCLEGNKIMPHLAPDVVETLVVMDGIAKLGAAAGLTGRKLDAPFQPKERKLRDLIQDVEEEDRWI
jgi:hypothetical protein